MLHFLQPLKSEKGSVMLEFCLVLPIYLLLFGGTFLMFDLSMAKLHLQEANRNLTWMQNDRFDSEGKITQTLYQRSVDYFELRNTLEGTMDDAKMWSFGDQYADYQKKQKENEGNACTVTPDFWGHKLTKFKERGVEIEMNNCWARAVQGLVGDLFGNDYHSMYSGNMELKMEKLSAVYIGAVGLSSVLMPLEYDGNASSKQNSRVISNQTISHNETVPLYKRGYVLTRALDENDKCASANGEMLLLRRTGGNNRNNVKSVNNLFFQNIVFLSWPSNGTLGDIQLFTGVGL